MVPAGQPTEAAVSGLGEHLEAGDTIIDGGNTRFKDDVRRNSELSPLGIGYVDVGTSGGVWGADRGYCLMIGGKPADVDRLTPIFHTLAPGPGSVDRTPGRDEPNSTAELGYLHCGPVGSGHFVKMVRPRADHGGRKRGR